MTQGPTGPDAAVIGVLGDPDLPARLARSLAESLPAELTDRDDRTEWRVEVYDDPFEAMYPDLEHIIDKAGRRVRDTSWDLALCLTDLPMRSDGEVLLASLDLRHRVALISLPALGGVRLRSRLRELAAGIVDTLHNRDTVQGRPAPGPADHVPFRNIRVVQEETGTVLVRRGGWARFGGLLAGMVRANRPWRLFIGLSSALAGALAGAAFGILYSNIWQLAIAMGPYRLAVLVLAAIAALILWIIVGHGLWERTASTDPSWIRDVRLRNVGTVLTVGFGAVVFFGAVLLCTCAAVAVVVPPSYLETVLGGPVGLGEYATIAVMAGVMGIVAGAVGSGLEDDLTVRKATYSYRDRERRLRLDREDRAGS